MTTMPRSESLILFIEEQQVLCFSCHPDQPWESRKIKGEYLTPLNPDQPKPLEAVLKALCSQLNRADDLASLELDFFYDQPSVGCLLGIADLMQRFACPAWQIIRLERLQDCARQRKLPPVEQPLQQFTDESSAAARWLRDTLLPTAAQLLWGDCAKPVADANPVTSARTPAGKDQGHESQLRQEIARLETRLAALRPVDGELLLSFLPALYAKAFMVLNGTDLAMLVGRVESFQIDSPFPEPSSDALHRKQKEFLALPQDTQRQIVQLVSGTTKKLSPRPEMRDLIRELEDG